MVQTALSPLGIIGSTIKHGFERNASRYSTAGSDNDAEHIKNAFTKSNDYHYEQPNIAFTKQDQELARQMLQNQEFDEFKELSDFFLVLVALPGFGRSRIPQLTKKVADLAVSEGLGTRMDTKQMKYQVITTGQGNNQPVTNYAVKVAKRAWNFK